MNFLRQYWYDLGAFLSLFVLYYVYQNEALLIGAPMLLWLSLWSLFIHQFEEYRFPGGFARIVNVVMYQSKQPDRFPLNTNTALAVNVYFGWTVYFLAAYFAESALWLGIATMLVSVSNTVVHVFVFNIKGKTWYNPGMATSVFLFLPLSFLFFNHIVVAHLTTTLDWAIGLPLGVAFNYFGILKPIDWLADANTKFVFV